MQASVVDLRYKTKDILSVRETGSCPNLSSVHADSDLVRSIPVNGYPEQKTANTPNIVRP